MHIAHLARAENELLTSPLEDELRFIFREHVGGAVVLLRQLLLPLHHFAGEANDHIVLIGQTSPPQSGASPSVRLAVFARKGNEKIHLGTITLSKADDRTWNVQAAGPSDESVETLRPFVERFADERRPPAEAASAPHAAP